MKTPPLVFRGSSSSQVSLSVRPNRLLILGVPGIGSLSSPQESSQSSPFLDNLNESLSHTQRVKLGSTEREKGSPEPKWQVNNFNSTVSRETIQVDSFQGTVITLVRDFLDGFNKH